MRPTTKQVKNAIRQYIQDNITLQDYDKENTLQNLYDVFMNEYGRPYKGTKHEQYIFIDWLKGSPSAFNVELYFSEAIKVLQSWGLSVDDKSNTILFDWYLFLIYRELKALLK
jgi:hypothetical protein